MVSTHRRWLRWLAALGIVFVVAFGVVGVASALERDDDGTVAADEVIDDDLMISYDAVTIDGTVNGNVFASGGTVTVNGTIDGNLLANGGTVTLNGVVHGSMAVAAQTVVVNGSVEGSLYCAGASLVLAPEGSIGRNVIFTGFGLDIQEGVIIERDVLATGFQMSIAGTIDGDVEAETEALEISGTISGDVEADVGAPGTEMPPFFMWSGFPEALETGIRVTEGADIGGYLTYESTVEQDDAIDAVPGGGVTFELVQATHETPGQTNFSAQVGHWFVARVRQLITLFVLGSLIAWKLPSLLHRPAEQMRSKPLPAAGWGVVMLIAGYGGAGLAAGLLLIVGILLAIVTLGGLAGVAFGVGFSGLSLAFTIFLLLVTYGSKLVVSLWGGRLVLKGIAPQYVDHRFWPLFTGILLFVFFRGIPFLGWLFGIAATLFGLGALWLTYREWRRAAVPAADTESDSES